MTGYPIPVKDRIAMVEIEQERTTAAGIVLPGAPSDNDVLRWKVVSHATGATQVKTGDIVLWCRPPAFRCYSWAGEKVWVVSEEDVLGVEPSSHA